MSSYDEHLISQAGGDGDVLGGIEARSDYALTHESLTASDYAEMAWESARDVPYLLALVREQAAKLEAVQLACSTIENLTVPQAGQNWHITGEKSAANKIRKALGASK